jgi:hypothetical protein
MVMQLAGKYQDLSKWSETPEATGGQYPTLRQELDRQFNIFKASPPGSDAAVKAMIAIGEIQSAIKEIHAENKRNYPGTR